MLSERPGLTSRTSVLAFDRGVTREIVDALATEEPLEIRISSGGVTENIGITMRTPGNDFELAAGFLFSEGVLRGAAGIRSISYCSDGSVGARQHFNSVNVELTDDLPDAQQFTRRFAITSSCGICGRAALDALRSRAAPIEEGARIDPSIVEALPAKMREAQRVFATTGGLHAAALFDLSGEIVALREDVGRHNALDKLIGWALLNQRLPLAGYLALVSGRASYELVQKCIVARIPILCAVSAPSSLAVELAQEFNLTLIGFVRDSRCNVYSARSRLAEKNASTS